MAFLPVIRVCQLSSSGGTDAQAIPEVSSIHSDCVQPHTCARRTSYCCWVSGMIVPCRAWLLGSPALSSSVHSPPAALLELKATYPRSLYSSTYSHALVGSWLSTNAVGPSVLCTTPAPMFSVTLVQVPSTVPSELTSW